MDESSRGGDHSTSNIAKITAEDETKIIAAKVILHGEKKKKRRNTDYLSFITAEAYFAIQKWLDFRRRYGENITGESYVMRHLFRVAHLKRADDPGAPLAAGAAPAITEDDIMVKTPRGPRIDIDAAHPTKMPRDSISSLLAKAMYEQGLRPTLEEGKTRHQIKSAHFSRKFFKTRAGLYMNTLNVEKLMDRKIGLDPNYWKPIEHELLADYLKAVPVLTINESNVESLKRQQEELEKKQQEEAESTKKQIQRLTENQEKLQQIVNSSLLTISSQIKMFETPSLTEDNKIIMMRVGLKYQKIKP